MNLAKYVEFPIWDIRRDDIGTTLAADVQPLPRTRRLQLCNTQTNDVIVNYKTRDVSVSYEIHDVRVSYKTRDVIADQETPDVIAGQEARGVKVVMNP